MRQTRERNTTYSRLLLYLTKIQGLGNLINDSIHDIYHINGKREEYFIDTSQDKEWIQEYGI